MRWNVVHTTEYTFSGPVVLDPHVIRLRPRSDGSQVLTRFEYSVRPVPGRASFCLDPEGNVALHAWFEGRHSKLEIRVVSEVETVRSNPFDYLPDPGAETLPIVWGDGHQKLLRAYLGRLQPAGHLNGSGQIARLLARHAEERTIPFLMLLTRYLNENIKIVHREEGLPDPPGQTLFARQGACRDVAVLFMDICRQQGIPTRFVSGYHVPEPPPERLHLHAWVEAYVPGGGWRGFDPALGLAVADRHIALAAAARPPAAAPVSGAFRGDAAAATLRYHIDVEPV
jgi:transglutaminase-like putative cysteine protease